MTETWLNHYSGLSPFLRHHYRGLSAFLRHHRGYPHGSKVAKRPQGTVPMTQTWLKSDSLEVGTVPGRQMSPQGTVPVPETP